jgi:transcriptional regulator with XRE-family HTH domain
MNPLARKIRERRVRLGLKLTDLAKRAGITVSKASEFEVGTRIPPDAPLARIADALGLDFSELVEARREPSLGRELERIRQAADRGLEIIRRSPVVARDLDPRAHGALRPRRRRASPAMPPAPAPKPN